mmetsp:Transcript_16683/g.54521  ORF Transcript_16683/g.54521 Transcript_16683/m.54521 type:complete len:526 (-) Transcript_16683:3314-4891(-)
MSRERRVRLHGRGARDGVERREREHRELVPERVPRREAPARETKPGGDVHRLERRGGPRLDGGAVDGDGKHRARVRGHLHLEAVPPRGARGAVRLERARGAVLASVARREDTHRRRLRVREAVEHLFALLRNGTDVVAKVGAKEVRPFRSARVPEPCAQAVRLERRRERVREHPFAVLEDGEHPVAVVRELPCVVDVERKPLDAAPVDGGCVERLARLEPVIEPARGEHSLRIAVLARLPEPAVVHVQVVAHYPRGQAHVVHGEAAVVGAAPGEGVEVEEERRVCGGARREDDFFAREGHPARGDELGGVHLHGEDKIVGGLVDALRGAADRDDAEVRCGVDRGTLEDPHVGAVPVAVGEAAAEEDEIPVLGHGTAVAEELRARRGPARGVNRLPRIRLDRHVHLSGNLRARSLELAHKRAFRREEYLEHVHAVNLIKAARGRLEREGVRLAHERARHRHIQLLVDDVRSHAVDDLRVANGGPPRNRIGFVAHKVFERRFERHRLRRLGKDVGGRSANVLAVDLG